jgi:hypothetical protein
MMQMACIRPKQSCGVKLWELTQVLLAQPWPKGGFYECLGQKP